MNLIVLHCRLGYDGFYRIQCEWKDGDILVAMQSAVEQFGLEPEE